MKNSVNKAIKQNWTPLKEVKKVTISAEKIKSTQLNTSKTKTGRQKIA